MIWTSRAARLWLSFLIAVTLFTLGLAVGPRVSGDALDLRTPEGGRVNCLTAIDLPGPFGILLNCDSPEYMEAAANPQKLLEPRNVRQDRPGQVWAAWLLSKPLGVFSSTMISFASRDDVKLPEGRTRTRAQAIGDLAPVFLAYYLINLVLLALAVLTIASVASGLRLGVAVVAIGSTPLLFNDITKAYLIAPHCQLMNIVVPVLLAALLFQTLRGQALTTRQVTVLGVISGLGLLAYPTWVFVPVAMIACIAWVHWQQDRSRAVRRTICTGAIVLALSIVPYILWYAYVVHSTGAFYQHAADQDEMLVWVLRGEPLEVVQRFIGNMAVLSSMAARQSWPYLVLASIPAALVVLGKVRLTHEHRRMLILATVAAAFVSVFFLLFFSVAGARIWRYAFPALPAWALPLSLLVGFAHEAMIGRRSRVLYLGLQAAICVAIGVATVVKDGPWG